MGNAIQRPECELARHYARLVPRNCGYDERRQRHVGKNTVMARIAGQLVSTIYALLKRDAELLAQSAPGRPPPEPLLYDPVAHEAHREGHYRASKPRRPHATITAFQSAPALS